MEAVRRWKRELNSVAVEEMFHLAVVTNLLTAIGGPPHFDRPNFPHDCAYYLPDYQIELHGLTEETIDHFLAIEQPDGSNVPALRDPARKKRIMGQLENEIGPDPHHFDSQGDVYAAVLACLGDLVQRHSTENIFIGAPPKQALRNFFESRGWEYISDLGSAERNLEHVVNQGEGAHPDSVDSHYAKFRTIRDEFHAFRDLDPSFDPAYPVVANPFTRTPPEGHGPVNLISNELSNHVSDLFNETYGAMLDLFGRMFISFDETEEEVDALCKATLGVMAPVINPIGNLLCRLPAGDAHPGMTSGPSFALRTVHSLPDKKAAWHLLGERFEELGNYARALPDRWPEASSMKPVGDRLIRIASSLWTAKSSG
jgi:hypothetical protein